MRSLPELQEQAKAAGFAVTGGETREELMDLLRGIPDELQIDPMKAKDLKNELAWGTDDPYVGIARYFHDGYIMEPKLDGARMRIYITHDGIKMNTSRRSTVTYAYIERQDNFPQITDHSGGFSCPLPPGTIIDGEIMAPKPDITTESGKVTNSLLNAAVALTNVNPEDSIVTQEREGYATFWAFDLLAYAGQDLTDMPWYSRRESLEVAIAKWDSDYVKIVPVHESASATIDYFLAQDYEGAMIKFRQGPYKAGKRSSDWLKVKTMSTVDVIDGYLEGRHGAATADISTDGRDSLNKPPPKERTS